ncbi:MAG TPA: aminotransferase class V-fold PLP-dependent enzyme, partial [Acidimicrobiales bacterium]|nr:aminotransferase class V-fold PLP-dependent enzyme [Acidimicrobiales bacterium]
HCPPLAVAVAADVAVSALNPSLDSWDQAPSGVAVEARVVAELARLAGLPPTASGSVTSGATESNLMAVLLAREHLGPGVAVVCSAAAHFSVARAARVAGLGDGAVVEVAVDGAERMDVAALESGLAALGDRPAVVVATAGTTGLGAVDPLPAVAAAARRAGAWLHVDAAYGGGALFSDRLRPLLDGLGGADSVALDLHKLGWQPAPAGVFLARAARLLEPLGRRAAYLNPGDDEAAGYRGRLAQSLRTTRRPDAFPVAVTMRALGRRGLGELVERCHDLALHAAGRLGADDRFRVAAVPVLPTVVFRWAAAGPGVAGDAANAGLRRRLLADGTAVVGRTDWRGATWLKLTLLHPHASTAAVDGLVDAVAAAAVAETARGAVA